MNVWVMSRLLASVTVRNEAVGSLNAAKYEGGMNYTAARREKIHLAEEEEEGKKSCVGVLSRSLVVKKII